MAVFSVGASFWMIEGDSSFISSNLEQREPGLQLVAGDAQFCIKGTDDVIYKWKRIEDSELNDLSDVNAGSPTTNQVLKWDGAEWVPGTFSVSISGTPNYIAMFDGAGTDVTDTFIVCNSTTMFISNNKLIGFGNTISAPRSSFYNDGTDMYFDNASGDFKITSDVVVTGELEVIGHLNMNGNISTGTGRLGFWHLYNTGFEFSAGRITTNIPIRFEDSEVAFRTSEDYPSVYSSKNTGSVYPFLTANNLVLQGSSNTNRDIVFVNGSTPAVVMSIDNTGAVFLYNLKSGATQVAAGAAANEVWVTSGHATQEDNTLMIGV